MMAAYTAINMVELFSSFGRSGLGICIATLVQYYFILSDAGINRAANQEVIIAIYVMLTLRNWFFLPVISFCFNIS